MTKVFETISERNHEQVVYCNDPSSGLKAIIAIHNTALGPALGGCRMYPYKNEEDALIDVLRLSKGMTYKASIANLNLGGGKSVIIADPEKDKSEVLLRSFGKFVDSLNGKYITAEDVGISVHDMEYIRMETKHVTGIKRAMGGSGDPSILTAFGVYIGMQAALKKKDNILNMKGLKIGVQGLGKVGYYLCNHLKEGGAEIYGYDIDKNKLNKAVEDFGLIPVSNDELLSIDLDIFSPCALGAIINPDSIKTLKCSIIAGAANNQLEKESRDSKLLLKKKIMYVPDYVINAGGLMNVANELQGYNQEKARYQVEGIYYILMRIFDYAIANNISTLEAANHLAERRITEFVKWNHKWMK
jgi:leucine dehydrogenase